MAVRVWGTASICKYSLTLIYIVTHLGGDDKDNKEDSACPLVIHWFSGYFNLKLQDVWRDLFVRAGVGHAHSGQLGSGESQRAQLTAEARGHVHAEHAGETRLEPTLSHSKGKKDSNKLKPTPQHKVVEKHI